LVDIINILRLDPTMAKRKYERMTKIEPAVMTMTFQLPTGAASSTIDLSQCASILNRRFYRQGLNWGVAGFKVVTQGATTGGVTISKIPNTWVSGNSWEKGMRKWLEQQNDAVDDAGLQSGVARFRDFKIHLDGTHVDASFAANLIPIDLAGSVFAQGEWDSSRVVVPNQGGVAGNSQEYSLHMVGADDPAPAQSKGLILAYQESRGVPQSPDPVTPVGAESSLYVEMFDDGMNQEDIIDNAIDRNDNLPYPQLDYPGADVQAPTLQLHDTTIVTGTTIGGSTSFKGGNFPCGLIRINSNLTVGEQAPLLLVDLIPGTHRGYLAESMTEM